MKEKLIIFLILMGAVVARGYSQVVISSDSVTVEAMTDSLEISLDISLDMPVDSANVLTRGLSNIAVPDDSTNVVTKTDSLDTPPVLNMERELPARMRAGNQQMAPPPVDTINLQLPALTSWLVVPEGATRVMTPMDTVKHNFQQSMLPDGHSVAGGYLAPLGSPFISKIFFDRDVATKFPFYDQYYLYNRGPENQLFYNTRVPYAKVDYQTAGDRRLREHRLQALLTSNFGKKVNVSFMADIIDAKGFYESQGNKHTNWSLFGNYIGDRFQGHLYASTGTIKHFENGGITDETFITKPDSIGQSFSSTDIPVKFTKTWNKLATKQVFMSGKYDFGFYTREQINDSVSVRNFVPFASASLTSHVKSQDRRFLSHDTANVTVEGVTMQRIDQFYDRIYYNKAVDDSTTFMSVKNTFALSLREGFKPWVKFGLTGYINHELRRYTMLDLDGNELIRGKHTENAVHLGGVLNKQQGEFLKFDVQADVGLLGADLGELTVKGDVETAFNIAGKQTTLSGHAYLKNITPGYLQNNYHSKYFWWNKDFGDTRRVFVGGELYIPFTRTTLSAGVENLQNYIYFNSEKQIAQHSDNVQVLMAKIDQRIRLGVFNWDNQVVYQTSSNESVIPVPQLSVYSNLYLKALIVNELTLQLGVDAHYHTKYMSPGYEPALLQFYNQNEKEIGNYPIATAYANMHLKQTRFFVMFYNIGAKFIRPYEYFSLPNYPVNPFILKLGLSVDLNN